MANAYVNKVQKSNGEVLLDISDSTAIASDVTQGKTIYLSTGEKVTGTNTGGTAAISVVDTADSHGGTVRTITALDISDTTAVASDVAQGKYFYTAAGVKTAGTSSGGSPSVTQHSIYLEFTDETDATIPVYYNDSFVGSLITSTEPATYGQKYVSLAQLDGVTWYEPAQIPIGVELIDYYAVSNGYYINGDTGEQGTQQYSCCSDFTRIDPSMTFTYVGYQWWDMAFYDESKTYISGTRQDTYKDTTQGEYVIGTLNSFRIPSNAVYIRLSSYPHIDPTTPSTTQVMSLIRTA